MSDTIIKDQYDITFVMDGQFRMILDVDFDTAMLKLDRIRRFGYKIVSLTLKS